MSFWPNISIKNRDYASTLQALESLIVTNVPRVDRPKDVTNETNVDAMNDYIRRLSIDLSSLSVIHVAGTKGKGSTCTFCESILRSSGFKTGIYTSPHLLDVRERIKVNGIPVSQEKFSKHFWECWDELTKSRNDLFPSMATYFRFLTLICFRVFIEEKVDVAIIETGLGGRLDATNVVKPIVCGISSLGYDHMEILGDSLGKIAWEKAGIIKPGVPVISQPQREEALTVLQDMAIKRKSELLICPPLSAFDSPKLGLSGKHQEVNASLALSLSWYFLKSQGREYKLHESTNGEFPGFSIDDKIAKGLEQVSFPGRGDIVAFKNGITFYIDGAHTEESLDLASIWFDSVCGQKTNNVRDSPIQIDKSLDFSKYPVLSDKLRILVFNYTQPRDPAKLLKPLLKHKYDIVVFCPIESSKVSLSSIAPTKGQADKLQELSIHFKDTTSKTFVTPSIDEFLQWIFSSNKQVDIFITGSLYLVGDFIKKLSSH